METSNETDHIRQNGGKPFKFTIYNGKKNTVKSKDATIRK